jgi:SAM-dependent methyltransferase
MPVVGKVRIGPWSEGFFAYWMTEDARVPQITDLSDQRFVSNQYRNAGNLNARIALHQRFSTNPYGWLRWVFDQFQLAPQCRILEIGCGTGDLWRENLDRIPEGWEITLSDFSAGMLDQTGRNLAQTFHTFRYLRIDAQCIPLEGDSFDAVIANHMLYHVPDRNKALAEIKRVLKSGGRFYASTNGGGHVHELSELTSRFDADLSSWGWHSSETFLLENGAAQLSRHFAQVALRRYEDSLLVTEAAPMVDYLLSGRIEPLVDNREKFIWFVQRELAKCGGTFHVTKDSGLFEAIR